MADNDDPPAPKIIVDSDWKEQVAREKELAANRDAESADSIRKTQPIVSGEKSPPTDIPAPAGTSARTAERATTPSVDELPPAGLESIVSILFTQGLMALGQMPTGDDPDAPPMPVNKPLAKHVIDSIEKLVEKTNGNTTKDEHSMLQGVLHALRMAYVNTR